MLSIASNGALFFKMCKGSSGKLEPPTNLSRNDLDSQGGVLQLNLAPPKTNKHLALSSTLRYVNELEQLQITCLKPRLDVSVALCCS